MRDYTYFSPSGITSKSAKSHRKFLAITLILLIVGSITTPRLFRLFKSKQELLSPTIDNGIKGASSASHKELLATLEQEIAKGGGTYAIYIYDLKNKRGFGINEKTNFTAASVNKIPILAALYHLAGKGKIDLERIIVPQQKDIQDYGTGSIRYDPTGTPYSLRSLARLMMEKSDNTAAYLIGTVIIGMDDIQRLVDGWGLTQTNMVENKSSVYDMSILLTKMYMQEITTPQLTAEMLGFMDKSDFDDRIPAGIEDGIVVYHKTGDEIGKIHDVGIVELANNPYYLGVMTTDMRDDDATKKTIATISKTVFEFMNNL